MRAPAATRTYDAIVIGGGHNGLVAACYLARAKRRVLVLERRAVVGGACVTEETFPGFKVSTAAYVNSLFRPEIVRDLRLRDYGFELIERHPSSFSPFEDGRYLMLGADEARNAREIAKFSARDAERYPRYVAMLERVAGAIEPTLLQTPPNAVHPGAGDVIAFGRLGLAMKRLGGTMGEALEILTGAARPILDRWFESEQLKATLATDAIIGAFASPSMPGTAYVLFHHVMGETNGARGVWSYVRGGMGGLTQALARAAADLGVEIRTEAEVRRIVVERGAAAGVVLANGDEVRARNIASGVDCRLTFETFLEPGTLPGDFLAEIRRIDYASASAKVNVALDALPNFTACPGSAPGPQHHGTIHLCPDQDYIERGFDDAKYGRPSAEPIVECTIPSSLDSDGRAARQARDVDVLPVRALRARGRRMGRRREERVRRSLLRRDRAVRARIHGVGDRPPGPQPAGHRGDVRIDRRQHLPGRDVAEQAVRVPPRTGVCELPHAGEAPLPVRLGGAPGRRRDGCAGHERGARDAANHEESLNDRRKGSGREHA